MPPTSSSVTHRRLFALIASALLSGALFALLVMAFGGGEVGIRSTLRVSGRLSFALFLPVVLASSLKRLFATPATRKLVKHRAELGLIFAGSHVAHLGLITLLATTTSASFPPLVIAFGGFGFIVIAALAATSFPWAYRVLGAPRWRALHRFGIHYIAVIFAYDWFKGLAIKPLEYAPLALLLTAAFVVRVAVRDHVRASH